MHVDTSLQKEVEVGGTYAKDVESTKQVSFTRQARQAGARIQKDNVCEVTCVSM